MAEDILYFDNRYFNNTVLVVGILVEILIFISRLYFSELIKFLFRFILFFL